MLSTIQTSKQKKNNVLQYIFFLGLQYIQIMKIRVNKQKNKDIKIIR